MSFTTVLGVMIGGGMLILAIAFGVTGNEMLVIDEPWGIFVNLSGLLIVLGGVIAATFISFPAQMIGRVFHSLIVVFSESWHLLADISLRSLVLQPLLAPVG